MKIMLFANTDWYLYNFRASLARALREAGHEVLLVSPTGPYGEKLQAQGFRWIPAPMDRRSLNPLKELALLNWLRQLMNRENGKPFGRVTFSGGVAEVTEDADTRSALARADAALYRAKQEGRNRVMVG